MEGQLISVIKEAENNIRKESIAINEKNNQIENTKRHLVSARTDLDHAERVANRAYSELRRRRREAESGFFSIYKELISFSVRSILFKYVFTSELVSRRKYSAVSMASYNPKKCAAKNPINGIEKKPLSASLLLLRSSL
jgi:hypothetical protein